MALAGCDILGPKLAFELPPEDLSLDPSALRPGPLAYPCGNWLGGVRPQGERLLVDIFFIVNGGIEAEGPVDVDRPVLAHRRLVERAGGIILRTYNLSGMRVWFPVDSIPAIQEPPREATVLTVPDARRYDVLVSLRYRDPSLWKADSGQIVSRGGRVVIDLTGQSAPVAAAYLPNRSLPSLRANRNLAGVIFGGNGLQCGNATPSLPSRRAP